MVLEDPFDDPPGLPVPERSPEPTKEQLDVSVAPRLDQEGVRPLEGPLSFFQSGRIGADEEIDDTGGKETEELEEILNEKEAKTRAILLEMVRQQRGGARTWAPTLFSTHLLQVGDLPDADVRPPENVLFVCKLNPVTADEDLEIIFSRFGSIKRC